MLSNNKKKDVSVWLWFVAPGLIFLIVMIIYFTLSKVGGNFSYDGDFYYFNLADFLINNENGLVELSTVIFLVIAVFYGLSIIRLYKKLPDVITIVWFCIITLGCFYFAGEEISWGQHIFKWQTPDVLQALNDQNETNIHNISSWFDQKPRLILQLFILISGIIIPIYIKKKNVIFSNRDLQYWIWPSIVILPTSVITIGIKIVEEFIQPYEWGLIIRHIRFSELQELYIAYFLMLYLIINFNKLQYYSAKASSLN